MRERRGLLGDGGCSHLSTHMPLHLAHPISSLSRPPPHPVSYQPTLTSTSSFHHHLYTLSSSSIPTTIGSPTPVCQAPSILSLAAACSEPAHLLEGRNHSFSLGSIS